MEITWYGHSCFRITERGMATVVTDPYDHNVVGYKELNLRADIVTISHDAPGHNFINGVKGAKWHLDGPGEYEIGGVFITGIATHADNKRGATRGLNNIFTFDFGGITVGHLGLIGHVPTQSQVESLGTVNVLLVPVGGGGSLTPARASEVISLFEPSIVVPMYYKIAGLEQKLGTLSGFLKEMGLEQTDAQETFRVNKSDLSEETQVVVLEPKRRDEG